MVWTPVALDLIAGGTYGSVFGLNDAGVAVGYVSVEGRSHAVVWDAAGNPTGLGFLGTGNSAGARGVSADGTRVVGAARPFPGSNSEPCLWDGGTPVQLGPLPGYSHGGIARSIASLAGGNDQIVGHVRGFDGGDFSRRAVQWDADDPTAPPRPFEALRGAPPYWDFANRIVDEGLVAGSSVDNNGFTRAVVWDAWDGALLQVLDPFDPVDAISAEEANSINPSCSAVVGTAWDRFGDIHAVVWNWPSGTVRHVLDKLGSEFAEADDVNDLDQVVGSGWDDVSEADYAAVWDGGTALTRLDTLGGIHAGAFCINAAGLIGGWADDSNGAWLPTLWTPSADKSQYGWGILL